MAALYERDQVGKRQALADIIANIESTKCPVSSMAKKHSKPVQKVIDYQAEVYPDRGFAGVVDGKDADTFDHVPRYPLKAICQKVWENPKVTDFAEETDVAGIQSEMKNQKAKALILCKRKIEMSILADKDSQEDNGTLANETRGLPKWVSATAQGHFPVPEQVRTPAAQLYSGTLANVTETTLLDMLAASFNQRKGPGAWVGILGSALKKKFSDFTRYTPNVSGSTIVRQFNTDLKSRVIYNVIDKLVTDFGEVELMLSAFLYRNPANGQATAKTTRSGLILDPDMHSIAYMRMPRIMDLQDEGGGPRSIVDTIFGLIKWTPIGDMKMEISADA